MAVDKLVDSTQLNSDLTSIANAIRAKSGGSSQLAFPAGFVSEIGNIPSGGSSQSTIDAISDGTLSGDITVTTTKIRQVFNGCPITSITAPNATQWNDSAFNGCAQLISASLPKITTGGRSAFYNCTSLTSLIMPKVTGMSPYSCQNCTALVKVAFPAWNTGLSTENFKGCTSLQVVDLANCTSLGSYSAFSGCSVLNTLILRKSNALVTLGNTNVFTSTPFASGGTGGTVYIPKALYDHLGDGTSLDYRAATNWATLYSAGTVTFAKIEGSYYETHYGDDTTIS